VELKPDDADGTVEVSVVAQGDTALSLASMDSCAISPADQIQFGGILQVVHVVFDAGTRVVDTAYARVLFEDRNRPVRVGGRVIGYYGMNLGLVRVNGVLLFPLLHRLGRRDSIAGIEYRRDMTSQYQAGGLFEWTAQPDSMDPVSVSVAAPEDVVARSPVGGIIVRRDSDLPVRWSGPERISIVISSLDAHTFRWKPSIALTVTGRNRRAVLSRKILASIPEGRLHVFTFMTANRRVFTPGGQFEGRALVQVSSAYNSYVLLR
jgi:hypothetical protein